MVRRPGHNAVVSLVALIVWIPFMVPAQCRTLIDVLRHRDREWPGHAAFTYDKHTVSFRVLWRKLTEFAEHLRHRQMQRGDRVVVALPNGPDFFFAFYGAHRAGGTAVPVSPDSGPERVLDIANLCGAKFVVLPSSVSATARHAFERQDASRDVDVMTVADSESTSRDADFPEVQADDVALIQYTSGSTGNPKGVVLSHANLMANLRQMMVGMAITDQESFVSWLPLHHDMGLILMTMMPLYVGAKLFLLPARLASYRHWLDAIQRHRATYTAAPDFAYRLCLRNIRNPRDFDLSSLRIALNAAEPVRSQTVTDFEQAFGLTNVMMPAYGLAEATVGVSMWGPGHEIKVDARGFVSVGSGFPDVELAIAHGAETVGPGVVGEIMVRSPGNTRGYYENPLETTDLFWKDDYIRTGDLGYRDADGDLFVVGRSKNIIIHAGRNVSPQEIEESVDVLPFVRFSAAVGIDRGGIEGEQVYVFVDSRGSPTAPEREFHDRTVKIVGTFHARLGFRPGRVYFLTRGAIPRTGSGKIQHAELKDRFLKGDLRAENQILFPDY